MRQLAVAARFGCRAGERGYFEMTDRSNIKTANCRGGDETSWNATGAPLQLLANNGEGCRQVRYAVCSEDRCACKLRRVVQQVVGRMYSHAG